MTEEATLEDVGSGLAPVSPGWFVVNVRDAAWLRNELFGSRCTFQTDRRLLRDRPDLDEQRFPQLGITLAVLERGHPGGLYHAESAQEGFLVLDGECLVLVDGEERTLRRWDFFHCPPGTAHVFVGVGERRCVLLMVGARPEGKTIVYPRSEKALARGAWVEEETDSPAEAYAPRPPWVPGCRVARTVSTSFPGAMPRPGRRHSAPGFVGSVTLRAMPRSPPGADGARPRADGQGLVRAQRARPAVVEA